MSLFVSLSYLFGTYIDVLNYAEFLVFYFIVELLHFSQLLRQTNQTIEFHKQTLKHPLQFTHQSFLAYILKLLNEFIVVINLFLWTLRILILS